MVAVGLKIELPRWVEWPIWFLALFRRHRLQRKGLCFPDLKWYKGAFQSDLSFFHWFVSIWKSKFTLDYQGGSIELNQTFGEEHIWKSA